MKKIIIIIFIVFTLTLLYFFFRNKSVIQIFTRRVKVNISATPPETKVYIDNVGPISLPTTQSVSTGQHEIDLVAEGHKTKIINITADPKKGNVDISESLIPTSRNLSFVPLRTEAGASSVGSDTKNVYYTIKDEIRLVKDNVMVAKAAGPIDLPLWSANGSAVFKAANNWFLFTPPHKIIPIKESANQMFLTADGGNLIYLKNNALYFQNTETGVATSVPFSINGGEIVNADGSQGGNHIVFTTLNHQIYNLILYSKNQNSLSRILGDFTQKPILAVSGESLAIVKGDKVDIISLSSQNSNGSYPLINNSGEVMLIKNQSSFLVFEKSTLFHSDIPATSVSYLNPSIKEKVFEIFDAGVKDRINLSFKPNILPSDDVVLLDNGGLLWLLTDTSNLPKSLFDFSLPKQPEGIAP
jgi:hypothetical protein